MSIKLGFIGGGTMSASLIGGIKQSAHRDDYAISVFEPNAERVAVLRQRYNITLAPSNRDLVVSNEVVLLVVKPQDLAAVLKPLASALPARAPLFISVVAGIRSTSIERWLHSELALVRAMPNAAALHGAGASGLFANSRTTAVQRQLSEQLFACVGLSVWVQEESLLDVVTALSGSGPAYFLLFLQGLIEAAEAAGLAPASAAQLALATMRGSARMVQRTDADVATLIAQISSRGGTTERALDSFAAAELKPIIATAFAAAHQRAEELALEYGG